MPTSQIELAECTPAKAERISKRRYLSYLVFAVCVSLYFLPFMRLLLGNGDEGLLITGAVRITQGQVFARDFFEVVGPGTFYWLALFLKALGATFFATRVCLYVASLGTAMAMYFLSRRVCTRYVALPFVLLIGTYFGSSWPAISHHVDSNCFALLAVVSMAFWLQQRQRAFLFVAGVLTAATTCCLQPKGGLLFLALLVWLWMQCRRSSRLLSSLGLLFSGYAGVLTIVLLYFLSHHAIGDLFYANVLWPARNYSNLNDVSYAQGLIHYYWDHFVIAKEGFRWTIVTASVLIAPFFFVATLPILLPLVAFRQRRARAVPEIPLYWLCGIALWLSELHRADICHLVFGSPLLIILCIYYVEQYKYKAADLALQMLTIVATCLAGFNFFFALAAHPVSTRVGTIAQLKQDPMIAVLESKAKPGEEIFAYPYCATYYFLSGTSNPTRYAALVYNFNTPSQFDEAITVLEQRRVKYVVWNKSFEKEEKVFFPAMKQLRPDQMIMEPYLHAHYRILWADSQSQLMERKEEDHANLP